MKQQIFKLLIAIAGLLQSAQITFAYDFKSNGIYYNVLSTDERTVEVTYRDTDYSYDKEYEGSVIIPSKVIFNSRTYSIISIKSKAFYDCSGLTSVTIGNSVTSIGEYAFSGCSGLTSIVVESENTTYDSRGNCNAIIETASNTLIAGCNNTVIPNSVTSIGNNAFSGRSGLTSVSIPNSVTSIGKYAFWGCTGLTSVSIPNSVTSIGEYAFWGCTGLTSVSIPNSVTSIGNNAFSGCSGLTSVSIPNSVTSIGNYAFRNCTGLTSVTIPNSVTSIGNYAFRNCTGLTSVTIGNSVTSIGISAFEDCTSLTTVNITDLSAWCKIVFGADLYNCFSNPLYYAQHLNLNGTEITNLVIPNDITNIKSYAFLCCAGLTSVTLPNSVTSIGFRAFKHCNNLRAIYCQSTTPPSAYNDFADKVLMYSTLYVPLGAKSAYEKVDPWRNFWNIVETDFSGIEDIAVDESAELSVSVDGDEIIVNNAENYPVTIYTLAGQQVYCNNAYNGESISLSNGVYIVKAGSKTQKVII